MRSSSRQPVSIHDCDSSPQFTFLTVIWHSYEPAEMCHVTSRLVSSRLVSRKYSFSREKIGHPIQLKFNKIESIFFSLSPKYLTKIPSVFVRAIKTEIGNQKFRFLIKTIMRLKQFEQEDRWNGASETRQKTQKCKGLRR